VDEGIAPKQFPYTT